MSDTKGKSPVESAREDAEDLPDWALDALLQGEGPITVRGHHYGPAASGAMWEGPEDERTGPPFEDFAETVEYLEGETDVDDPEAMAGGLLQSGGFTWDRTRSHQWDATEPHHNTRHTYVTADGGPVGRAEEVNITVDGDLTEEGEDTIREVIDDMAEEALKRSKNRLKR